MANQQDEPTIDDVMNNVDQSAPAAQTFNPNDIKNLLDQAKQTLETSQQNNITPDQLNDLQKHQGANMWANLFMNFIGNSAGIKDTSPWMKPLQQNTDNEKANLLLKSQLAQQQAQRAGMLQNFGMGNIKAQQDLNQLQQQQAPPSENQLQAGALINKLAGGTSYMTPDTQFQYERELGPLEKAAQLAVQKQMMQERGNILTTNPYTGEQAWANKYTQQIAPTGQGAPKAVDSNNLNYNDVINGSTGLHPKEIKNFQTQFKPIESNASKLVQEENDYKTAVDQLRTETKDSLQGNYVAGRTLPDREAQVFGNLKQRLSNMQVQMQKDPSSTGIANTIATKLKVWSGNGPVTEQDAKNMLALADDIENQRAGYYDRQKDIYRQQARGLVNNAPVNFDQVLFGSSPTNSPTNQSATTPQVTHFNSLDDYKKSLGQ